MTTSWSSLCSPSPLYTVQDPGREDGPTPVKMAPLTSINTIFKTNPSQACPEAGWFLPGVPGGLLFKETPPTIAYKTIRAALFAKEIRAIPDAQSGQLILAINGMSALWDSG